MYLLELHQLLDSFVDEMRKLRTKLTMHRGATNWEAAARRNWELGAENHRLRGEVYDLKKEVKRLKLKYEGEGGQEEELEEDGLKPALAYGRGRGRRWYEARK